MERQEIFDKAAVHLMKQGRRSVAKDGVTCLYRGPDGLVCGAGIFIEDEEYDASMEGASWHAAQMTSGGQRLVPIIKRVGHSDLIRKIQQLHDGLVGDLAFREEAMARLITLAEEENLSAAAIQDMDVGP